MMILSAALAYTILQRTFFRSNDAIGERLGAHSPKEHGRNILYLLGGTIVASLLGHLLYAVGSRTQLAEQVSLAPQFGSGLYGALLASSFLLVASEHFNKYLSGILTLVGISICSGIFQGSNYQLLVTAIVIIAQIALFTWKRDTFALFVCLLLTPFAITLGRELIL
jgi:hypothetical protein